MRRLSFVPPSPSKKVLGYRPPMHVLFCLCNKRPHKNKNHNSAHGSKATWRVYSPRAQRAGECKCSQLHGRGTGVREHRQGATWSQNVTNVAYA